MTTIFRPNPDLSAFSNGNTDPISALAHVFDNNAINAKAQVESQLKQAEMKTYQAKLEEEQAKKDQRGVAASSAQDLSDIFTPSLPQAADLNSGAAAVPGLSVADKLNDPATQARMNRALINASITGGMNPQNLANLLRLTTANAAVPDPIMARAAVGAGEKIGPNDAFSIGGQDRIRSGNVANSIAINDAREASKAAYSPTMQQVPTEDPMEALPTSGKTLYDNVGKSTGIVSSLSNDAARIAGLFGGTVAPDTVQARSDAELFGPNLVAALHTTKNFGEKEREFLSKAVAVEPSMFKGPEYEKQKLISLDNTLADMENKAKIDVNDPLVDKQDKSKVEQNLNIIRTARMQLMSHANRQEIAQQSVRGADNKIATPVTPLTPASTGGWSATEIK